MVQEIERVEQLKPETMDRDYTRQGKPVIITRMAEEWPALKKWSPSYFRKVCGNEEVLIRGSRVGYRLIGWVKLGEYIDWLIDGKVKPLKSKGEHHILAPYDSSHPVKPYVAYNKSLENTLVCKDFNFEPLFPPSYRIRTTSFWIGPQGAATPLHYDNWGVNLFFQAFGRKRFLLYPPEQSPLLYSSNVFEFTTVYSRVNLVKPDYEEFPRYRYAQPIEITLNPGDFLLLPRCWWHDVEALDTSISVNVWAVTKRDNYSPTYLCEKAKSFLHGVGIYAKGRCICHSINGKDLGQLLKWY